MWKVYVDGAANQRGAGLGLVLISPEEVIIEKSLRLGFSATNNEIGRASCRERVFNWV